MLKTSPSKANRPIKDNAQRNLVKQIRGSPPSVADLQKRCSKWLFSQGSGVPFSSLRKRLFQTSVFAKFENIF